MGWRGFTGLGCELRAAVNSAMSDTHKAFTHGLLQSWIRPSPCQRHASVSPHFLHSPETNAVRAYYFDQPQVLTTIRCESARSTP